MRILAEALVVIGTGFILALFMYSSGFRACCQILAPGLGIALFPAMQIAAVLGNGIHNVTPVDFAMGLVTELIAIWALLRVAKWAIGRLLP